MTRQEKIQVKADRYLSRIITIVGALGRSWTELRYDTAEYEFWIRPRSIRRINKRTGREESTCIRPPKQRMPEQEQLASVLLLLHDNPKLFETWRRQAGYINGLADRYRNEARREGLSADSLRRG